MVPRAHQKKLAGYAPDLQWKGFQLFVVLIISENLKGHDLGPVQTSCFCRAELNSGIKFDKSTVETRRLNQTFEVSSVKQLSSTSSTVLHDSGTAVIQTSCLCHAKLNS